MYDAKPNPVEPNPERPAVNNPHRHSDHGGDLPDNLGTPDVFEMPGAGQPTASASLYGRVVPPRRSRRNTWDGPESEERNFLDRVKREDLVSRSVWDWRALSACGTASSHQFFTADGERGPAKARRVAGAKKICGSCPVITHCFTHATLSKEVHGIWGGLFEEELSEFFPLTTLRALRTFVDALVESTPDDLAYDIPVNPKLKRLLASLDDASLEQIARPIMKNTLRYVYLDADWPERAARQTPTLEEVCQALEEGTIAKFSRRQLMPVVTSEAFYSEICARRPDDVDQSSRPAGATGARFGITPGSGVETLFREVLGDSWAATLAAAFGKEAS